MKIKYERPMAIFDEFASNQFIAACGEIITDNKAGMNCVNRNHYWGVPQNFEPANSKYQDRHKKYGTTSNGRVENVFTSTSFGCGTCIGAGQSFSDTANPISGPVYVFNSTSGTPINYNENTNQCFGAYVRKATSSSVTNPFSA